MHAEAAVEREEKPDRTGPSEELGAREPVKQALPWRVALAKLAALARANQVLAVRTHPRALEEMGNIRHQAAQGSPPTAARQPATTAAAVQK